jgi:hypothetical protein
MNKILKSFLCIVVMVISSLYLVSRNWKTGKIWRNKYAYIV